MGKIKPLFVDESYHRLFKTEASKRGMKVVELSKELADVDKVLKIDRDSLRDRRTKSIFPEFRI